ncbi:hypothetical protein CTAYLR_000480 [Chrysophaeum taylorii]|uniref:F-box/LRR-repeat protein 15-like leucin rich repeat domain-containing protein n=1 Tax=Chrysophaeum taylorii TaxID=2483200 RepID=A0AAD7XN36_9STRA|nr:hypothetical protein CTAYLR_000480 [Chrysophaeum taylorii]
MGVSRAWFAEGENPVLWTELDCRLVLGAYGSTGIARLRKMFEASRFSLLESINLECCKPVGDAELELLHAVAGTLRRVNLNALHTASPEAIATLGRRCVRCEALSLYWHPRLGDAVLQACATSMGATLRDLNVAGCGGITDAGLAMLVSACARLERLNVTRCSKLTDASLRHIADAAGRHLLELNAYANRAFSDQGYGYLANSGIPTLEKLDTCGAQLLTSPALSSLVRRCGATLVYLNCSWCVALDDRAGIAVADNCSALGLLSFHGIIGITDVAIDVLAGSALKTTLTTLDINGCARVTDYRRETRRLYDMFPNVTTWIHHR